MTSPVRLAGAPLDPKETCRVITINRVEAGDDLGLLCDAVEVVGKAQYAHQDLIQRRVRVGFAKAGRLLYLMEDAGIIGPLVNGQKRREVLVSAEQVPAVLAELRGKVFR